MKNLKFKRFIGPIIAAAVIFAACTFANGGIFGEEEYRAENLLYGLANCFTIPGVLLAGVGAISWAGKFGTFDMLGYGTKSFFGIFIRPLADDLPSNFYDYRKQKDEKGRVWLLELFLTGVICLVIAGLITAVSMIVY